MNNQKHLKSCAKKIALINFGENKGSFKNLQSKLKNWKGLENLDLATVVSTKKEYIYGLRCLRMQKIKNLLHEYFPRQV